MLGNDRPAVMFTGHRYISKSETPEISRRLDLCISAYAHARFFVCGGAMGFDTLAAKAVLRAKAQNPEIKLMLALPCSDQDKRWPNAARLDYDIILACADMVFYATDGEYQQGCMHMRNQFMVDATDICVCYFRGTPGGTSTTVNYAKKRSKKLIYIDLSKEPECE